MGRLGGLGSIIECGSLEVSEDLGSLYFEDLKDRDCEATDLDIGGRRRSQLDEMAPGASVAGNDDLCLGRIREHGARGLSRTLPSQRRLGLIPDLLFDVSEELAISGERIFACLLPCLEGWGPINDLRWENERYAGLIDVSLGELRIAEASAMANELVSQCT